MMQGIGKSKDSAEQAASKILELMPDQGWIVERACLGLMPWRIDRDKHGHEEWWPAKETSSCM